MSDHRSCKRCGTVITPEYWHWIEDVLVCYPCKVRHDNLMARLREDRKNRPAQWN